MDELRLSAVAARLVAWHNRHPLARRIGASHIHAIGYVALPFVAPGAAAPAVQEVTPGELAGTAEGGSVSERAVAFARQHEAARSAESLPAPGAATAPFNPLAALQPDFSETFIDTLQARTVARFALEVGVPLPRAPTDGRVRQVRADGSQPGRAAASVYLLTAVIETGTRKSRVLLGAGLLAPVLGPRIFSTPRVAGVTVLLTALLALVALTLWLLLPGDAPRAAPVVAAPAAAPAADAAASAAAAVVAAQAAVAASAAAADNASAALVAQAPASSATAAQAADEEVVPVVPVVPVVQVPPTASDAPGAAAPLAAPRLERPAAVRAVPAAATAALSPDATGPATGPAAASAPASAPRASARAKRGPLQIGLPSIRPQISEEDMAKARAARQAHTASTPAPTAQAGAGQPAAVEQPLPAPQSTAAAARSTPAPNPAAAPATEPRLAATPTATPAAPTAFALTTRMLRTRAEADQVRVAMRALLQTLGAKDVKVDVLSQGDDWRVVGMPFARRADADKARALLVSRGMRVEVVGF